MSLNEPIKWGGLSDEAPAKIEGNVYADLIRPSAKFTEQAVSDVIAPADEYEIWCADIIQGLWIAKGCRALDINDINNALGKQLDLTRVYQILGSPSFFARLQARGVDWLPNWNPVKHEEMRMRERLTPQQVWALQIMTDPTDRRSINVKLKQIGITYAVWRSWLSEPFFAELVRSTAEKMLQDGITVVHTAMLQKAAAGDTGAMKLFYEVSGRHDPNRQQMLDFTKVLGLILEVLQRHVTDQQTLARVTLDIDKVINGGNLSELKELPANLDPNIIDAEVVPDVPNGFFDIGEG